MYEERRQILADYLDQRVGIVGFLDRVTSDRNPNKPFRIALLQEVVAELRDRDHELGHIWLQHADSLTKYKPGDHIRCTCRVTKYRKVCSTGDGQGLISREDYSLCHPNQITLIGRPLALKTAHEPDDLRKETPAPVAQVGNRVADSLEVVCAARDLAQKVGGIERIGAFRQAVSELGGRGLAQEIIQLEEGVGGWDRLERLLSVVRL